MKTLQIIMPMVGLGSRFSDAGFDIPKPLLKVDGVPMFKKALSSLEEIDVPKKIIFVIRRELQEKFFLKDEIINILPDAKVVIVEKLTGGAAETCLMAKKYLNPEDPLVAMDCDLYFKSKAFTKNISNILLGEEEEINGCIVTFLSDSPRYSYAKTDNKGYVMETAEKKVISDKAIVGAYFFSQATTFLSAAEKLIRRPITKDMPEYYISYIYNILLKDKGKIKVTSVDEYHSFGTPEELEVYEKNQIN